MEQNREPRNYPPPPCILSNDFQQGFLDCIVGKRTNGVGKNWIATCKKKEAGYFMLYKDINKMN